MPTPVYVLACKTAPILHLLVSRPALVDQALRMPGQTALEHFHITLARLDDLGLKLPAGVVVAAPPRVLNLSDDVRYVDSGEKQSCYAEVDAEGQERLWAYLTTLEFATGLTLTDPQRIFHVTLSNAGAGAVRSSVGSVWAHPSCTLPLPSSGLEPSTQEKGADKRLLGK